MRWLRSTWLLVGLVLGLSALMGLGLGSDRPNGAGAPLPPGYLAAALTINAAALQVPLVALLLAPLGSGAVGDDRRHGGARTTALTCTSRRTAYVAKLAVTAIVSGLAAASSVVVAWITASLVPGQVVSRTPLPWASSWRPLLSYVVVVVAWTVMAAAVSALLRRRVATALVVTLWPLLGERLLAVAIGRVEQLAWLRPLREALPFAAARSAVDSGSLGELSPAVTGSGLGAGAGLCVFLGFVMVLAVAGGAVHWRADVR